MEKCVICEKRPASKGGYCANCAAHVEAEGRHREVQKPAKFLTYRGNVVGLFPNGDRTLRARLLLLNPDNLPKTKTLDLNTYLEGFTREQIKRFKACVLKLTNA